MWHNELLKTSIIHAKAEFLLYGTVNERQVDIITGPDALGTNEPVDEMLQFDDSEAPDDALLDLIWPIEDV